VENTVKLVKQIAQLSDFLKKRGVPFLFIGAPDNRSVYDAKYSPGYSDHSRREYHALIEGLQKAGVEVLDMDKAFEEKNLGIKDLYFRTDHHWNHRAGQIAAQKTMEYLVEKGIASSKPELMEDASFEIRRLPDWFLGSQGKRVGRYYAGTDDIFVYKPKYETDFSVATLSSSDSNWQYDNDILNEKAVEKKDYFNED
ncbi:MAG: hypothetical protein LUC43_03715, partial [Burkholderiales bacterium]|nr:hypothetical protein [Burkholderiales bacterium]